MIHENNENSEQVVLETLGSIETIHKIDELYNPEYECNLIEALKSKNNIIEKAKMHSFNRIVYKQKAKYARSLDSLVNTDYQDTFQNLTNEININNININNPNNNTNNNYNVPFNFSSINENYEELKLIDNCIKNNNNTNHIENNNKNIHNSRTILINHSQLNSKFIEEKNFESFQIGKKLKILQNFEGIDDKIRFGYINVVPKSSLLHVNENKLLSYSEIKKEINKKVKERNVKLKEANLKSMQNLTPFQSFELTRNLLREKIRFKKDIYTNQKSLLNNIIDGTDIISEENEEIKKHSINTQTMNFAEFTKETRQFLDLTKRENYVMKTNQITSTSQLPNINKFANTRASHLTVFDKFNLTNPNKIEENKTNTNYNKSSLRSGFNSHYETDRIFHINPRYRTNKNTNILEENLTQDLASLNNQIIKITDNEFKKDKFPSIEENLMINKIKDNRINIIECINEYSEKAKDSKQSKSNKKKKTGTKVEMIRNRMFASPSNKTRNLIKKSPSNQKTKNSERSNNILNNDINNISNNNIEESNSQILPTIENTITIQNEDNEKLGFDVGDQKSLLETNQKNINALNNSIENSESKALEALTPEGEENKICNKNKTNNEVAINASNLIINSNEVSKIKSNKKRCNNNSNNRSFETNKSISLEHDNSCIKYKKSAAERIFPNEPTFYGPMEMKFLNSKNIKNFEEEKKINYTIAAKTTLNYLSSALKTSNFNLEGKKNLFEANINNINNNSNIPKVITNSGKKNANSIYNNINSNQPLEKWKIVNNNTVGKEYMLLNSNNNFNNINNCNTKIELGKIKKHMRKASQNEILVNEMLDNTINDNVEIFKNVLNSRDYIPQSEYENFNTSKILRPLNYSNYKNKIKKNFIGKTFNSPGNKKFDGEKFLFKNGLSFSPKENKVPIINKSKEKKSKL